MQIVIEISEHLYKCLQKRIELNVSSEVDRIIANGVPLPEHHGRLIDANYLKDVTLLHNWHGNDRNIVPYSDRRGYRLRDNEVLTALINAPTIIEADRAESEDKK